MAHRIEDLDGCLAIVGPWIAEWAEPYQSQTVYTSNIRAESYPEGLIGLAINDWRGDAGVVWYDGKQYVFNLSDKSTWQREIERVGIPKPRAGRKQGRRYGWEWDSGQWRKVWGV